MLISRRAAFTQLLLMTSALSAVLSSETHAENYEYDGLGRLKRVIFPNGQVVEYAYDAAGNRTTVAPGATAPSGTFSASATSINWGASSTLSWTSSNATSASIDNGVGAVTPVAGGSVNVSPTATTTYMLTLVGAGGTVTRQVTVIVSGFNPTIAITGSGPVNLRTLANNAGYNGAQDAHITFTLASGVTIMGAANGGRGIDTGTWPTGSYSIGLTLQVSGNVYGGGGNGGDGAGGGNPATSATAGGDAIYCQAPMTIVVNPSGQVKGGGAGGGGGGGWTNGSLGEDRGGGGGGGGFPNGTGGALGIGSGGAANGSPGTTSAGGNGGIGDTNVSSHSGGAGGTGGGAAGNGSNGAQGGGAVSGGWSRLASSNGATGGYAIRKNGNTVGVTNNGTVTGVVG